MEVSQPTPVTYALYIGDLHPGVTDDQLVRAFADFPSVASVRICKDSRTDSSLGYGYVNFNSEQDATRALETKNYMQLNGKAVRLMWSRRDADYRKSGIGNVFVKNLSESVDHARLEEKFQEFGNILSCKVVMSEDGYSKGYGFIQFESEDSANSAIKSLNGTIFDGKKIYVASHIRKTDRARPSVDAQYTNLYVKNLDVDVTVQVLEEKFSIFGKISSIVISTDEHGFSRGFGFVNFVDPDDARRAVEAMNGLRIGSKVLYVGRAQKKAERQQILRQQFEEKRMEKIKKYKGSSVYVKNINDTVTEDMLRELFSQCGSVTSVKLMQDEKGSSRGFGFVCFSTPGEAGKAVNTFQYYMFHGKPLYVSIAQRKEERQLHLQMHYAQHATGIVGPSFPCGYQPRYFPASPGVIAYRPPQSALVYHSPIGFRPGWRGNTFAPAARPVFEPSRPPLMTNRQPQPQQIKGRTYGYASSQGHTHSRDSSNLQRTMDTKYAPKRHFHGVNDGTGVLSPSLSYGKSYLPHNTVELSSMLAVATPAQRKLILGEQLYPLVEQHKPNLASKITGMLMEMDNAEIMQLLNSPDSLAAKVEEAVHVLKLANTKASSEERVRSLISAEQVTVN